ncbi:MAG: hypothetical protein HYZ31_05250 [Gammaproteobacteria bacterium]|nr:hypothetical protein [Gammaproteobacteria bacterium]
MIDQVEGVNAFEAWQEGAKILIDKHDVFNLVTTVNDPVYLDPNWFENYNPADFMNGIPTLSDVASTIFPYKYLTRGYLRNNLYAKYVATHERAKKMHKDRGRRWGTYFDRMIRFGNAPVNQLDRIVDALNNWKNNPRSALVIHTSSADTDRPRPLGGPCLQYIELLCPDKDTISMLAVYRNHDFFSKAFGNFIGLGQLMKFLCEETNRKPGNLVCHSAHADYQTTKKVFKTYAKL